MTDTKNIFPVITLYQPWATWIMREWKTIETRTHDRFKGLKGKTILIHAGQTIDNHAWFGDHVMQEALTVANECPTGCILGSALVTQVGWLDAQHSTAAMIECGALTDRFGLFLSEIVEFDSPIFVKGNMGIWYFDISTNQKVKKNG